jgi:hydrogenase large subunit
MAATTIVIDPVTRIEGHLKIEVVVDWVGGVQQVVDAYSTGTLFRGLERILVGRDPRDGQHLTQRICGVCPVSHAMAAVNALDRAMSVTIPNNARVLRNLTLGANYLQSHVLHFYQLALWDFVEGPAMAPWQPSSPGDRRFDPATNGAYLNNYVKALDIRRRAHELGAVFAGRMPGPPAFVPGGFTKVPNATTLYRFNTMFAELRSFVKDVYLPDVQRLAGAYADYFQIGAGARNLLAFGVFDEDVNGSFKLLRRGRIEAGSPAVSDVDVAQISEDVATSWYAGPSGVNPVNGTTDVAFPKPGAYSWLKAPRYAAKPFETGALARMTINGDYVGGISVMDRHVARAQEALKVTDSLERWMSELDLAAPVYTPTVMPTQASGVGLTEAPRGALGHWLRIDDGKIGSYQIITPTCWNASPRDERGQMGPLESALVGTTVADPADPVEVLRVVHSYDPCLACAVHVMRPGAGTPVAVVSADPRS